MLTGQGSRWISQRHAPWLRFLKQEARRKKKLPSGNGICVPAEPCDREQSDEEYPTDQDKPRRNQVAHVSYVHDVRNDDGRGRRHHSPGHQGISLEHDGGRSLSVRHHVRNRVRRLLSWPSGGQAWAKNSHNPRSRIVCSQFIPFRGGQLLLVLPRAVADF